MLDQLWPLYSPAGNVDEYLNHILWLSLQLCAPVPQNPSSSLHSLFFTFLHLRIWFVIVTEGRERKTCLRRVKKNLYRVLMYSFKRIDAVAWKKINLSRHQAQEQLQRRMGVNCKSVTMPALQMDFSLFHIEMRGVSEEVEGGIPARGRWWEKKSTHNLWCEVILTH